MLYWSRPSLDPALAPVCPTRGPVLTDGMVLSAAYARTRRSEEVVLGSCLYGQVLVVARTARGVAGVQGSGFRVQGSGFWGSGCSVSEFRVCAGRPVLKRPPETLQQDLAFRVQGSGFRVQGLGFR
eukprot:1321593-Rhodomonas_salina.1